MSNNKTILVTGGTGYIGSHTVVELLNSGFKVVIADNLSNSFYWIVDRIKQISGKDAAFEHIDLSKASECESLFVKYKIDAVIHFAAFKAVGESVAEPLKYYQNNLAAELNLLQAMVQHGTSNFVFSSSCTVYGQPYALPVSEQSGVKPAESPYGNTKQIGEEILKDLVHANNEFQAISLRYFNPVGAHSSALLGELPIGKPLNLVPIVTQAAIGKRPALEVFGNDYDTPDGTCIRDYIHVVDLAQAHVIAIKRLLEKQNLSPYEMFNLGTGKGNSVLEVINAFEKVNKVKVPFKIVGRRPGDIVQIWADTSHANKVLNWNAKLDLDEMMRSAWAWQKSLA